MTRGLRHVRRGPRRIVLGVAASAAGRCLLVPLLGEPSRQPEFQKLAGPEPALDLALLRGFLDKSEIAKVETAVQDAQVWGIDDRDDDLGYAHEVWRMEEVMQQNFGETFKKLIDTAWSVERRMWGNILEFVFPEIEYIEYDVARLGRPGSISRHADNDSMITTVVLLSDPSEFEGGINCFDGDKAARQVPLQRGDAVFFFGDACHHWITPVTRGRRAILQMELRNRYEEPPRRVLRRKMPWPSGVRIKTVNKQQFSEMSWFQICA
ncbi:unnamed protein product [Effrenium voratum]|nr:unnamed protein product [Effrenium voratum]